VSSPRRRTPKTPTGHVRLAHYNDLDALVELYGFIRAVNPLNKVKYRTSNDCGRMTTPRISY